MTSSRKSNDQESGSFSESRYNRLSAQEQQEFKDALTYKSALLMAEKDLEEAKEQGNKNAIEKQQVAVNHLKKHVEKCHESLNKLGHMILAFAVDSMNGKEVFQTYVECGRVAYYTKQNGEPKSNEFGDTTSHMLHAGPSYQGLVILKNIIDLIGEQIEVVKESENIKEKMNPNNKIRLEKALSKLSESDVFDALSKAFNAFTGYPIPKKIIENFIDNKTENLKFIYQMGADILQGVDLKNLSAREIVELKNEIRDKFSQEHDKLKNNKAPFGSEDDLKSEFIARGLSNKDGKGMVGINLDKEFQCMYSEEDVEKAIETIGVYDGEKLMKLNKAIQNEDWKAADSVFIELSKPRQEKIRDTSATATMLGADILAKNEQKKQGIPEEHQLKVPSTYEPRSRRDGVSSMAIHKSLGTSPEANFQVEDSKTDTLERRKESGLESPALKTEDKHELKEENSTEETQRKSITLGKS